jgi:hypothetical protein
MEVSGEINAPGGFICSEISPSPIEQEARLIQIRWIINKL